MASRRILWAPLAPLALLAWLVGTCPATRADDAPPADASPLPAPAGASPLPELSGAPQGSPAAAASGTAYRVTLARGALDIGMRFELPATRAYALPFEPTSPFAPTVAPAFSLGLRRTIAAEPAAASSLIERAMGASSGDGYVSRVGIEWKPAASQVSFLREGLGVRLDGNNRMTVRLRKGVVGVYMHRKF